MADRQPGSYFIVMYLLQDSEIQIGRKGRFLFPKGYYIYTGSAMGGIWQRLRRICRPCSQYHRLRWHVDYFIRYPLVQIIEIFAVPELMKRECSYNQRVTQFAGALVPVPHFGDSDCVEGCPGHLIHFSQYPKGLWEHLRIEGEVLPLDYFP